MDPREALERGFRDAPFMKHLDVSLDGLGAGWCEASLPVQPWQTQQTGVVHAGVIAALGDHCAGAAATTQLLSRQFVVTVEFKLNLLRGAKGERLVCRAVVLKPGQRFSIVESEVWSELAGNRSLVAKMNATMAVMQSDN
jgi:uncharacterized protein (TIGR00369 family)